MTDAFDELDDMDRIQIDANRREENLLPMDPVVEMQTDTEIEMPKEAGTDKADHDCCAAVQEYDGSLGDVVDDLDLSLGLDDDGGL